MDLKKIIAITGKPGLYKLIATTRTGILVESLADGKKMPVSANQNASSLNDISMFTYSDDKPLREILAMMYKHYQGKQAPSHKEYEATLRAELEHFFPEYDRERVYFSDIKKLFQWYNILLEKGLVDEHPEPATAQQESAPDKQPEENTNADTQA
ncbi:DUF5606 family protein [Schleiferia thermophila]|jgi:hypothetical protein|uniref:Uncharacterized protein n=1 Tax=Schleiferia thermophila TaxID=884107 RepID=A0A369A8M1_9FLAO|nr:DUF5606 domain-containing protein [Schleiferia thermophila]KFD40136.1 hypothetical protein AT05_02240 [Schleiferia thermophila str. Yellowstone]PMB14833.1 hypothetical protein CEN47_27860 [Fischerella thermalis CCMEE 5319]RCX05669.1 hypothetical protein DES35_101957 [Schleiferia thermophila]GCD78842.1 hypothetical protein JCM30197_00890 [Schleiferia thermophila]